MEPQRHFHFCPRCGARLAEPLASNRLECGACGFVYYFNPTVAVAAFLTRPEDGRLLLVRRQRDPGKGRLAPPGGFIDAGETAEDALRRELTEEIGVPPADLRFIRSAVNHYLFRDVTYPVVDIFFAGTLPPHAPVQALDEVAEIVWVDPAATSPSELAFPSMRQAFETYLRSAHHTPAP